MTTLMIQGCTSDAGKSTMVTAICRLLARAGKPVAPFKPQNMALNSAVTADGGEIGRAQAVQAFAAGIPPHTNHNPVLLKPTSDCVAQVIIQGHAIGNLNALDYHAYKQTARTAVMASWERLATQYKWVIVEGAGSPAEVNLREGDIANMGFAEAVDCPVWLVADIDRGGVFAHIVGTLACLSATEQARIQGFIINRFRGDIALLEPGIDWLEEKTGKPVLAVVPYLHGLAIAAEDAIQTPVSGQGDFRIVVLTLPHISNHTDFDPLRVLPNVTLIFSTPGQSLPAADLLIIPGTKNTMADLAWLRQQGYDVAIQKHLRYGGKVIGICGGYQILGEWIEDPDGIEGDSKRMSGLGLLPCQTILQTEKQLKNVFATLHLNGQSSIIKGYEIHHGETQLPENATLLVEHASGVWDGLQSQDQQILGCYLHGLFDLADACTLLLQWAGYAAGATKDIEDALHEEIDRLADALDEAFEHRHQQSVLSYLSSNT